MEVSQIMLSHYGIGRWDKEWRKNNHSAFLHYYIIAIFIYITML
jgi:hypothetical protein